MSLEALHFYDQNIPCLAACPVNTNAGMYVAAIADGDDELAYLTARLPNPFASVCGRVCAPPCEDACRRGEIDRPIAIRALKRFVTDRVRPAAYQPAERVRGITRSVLEVMAEFRHPFSIITKSALIERDIDLLATAGVTRGCNPPANDRYCPDQVITRGQMAAFLRRAMT